MSIGYPGQIQARDTGDETPIELGGDATARALFTAEFEYDVASTSWVKKVAPLLKYLDERMEHDNNRLIYHGLNETLEAAEGDTDWIIIKIDYTGGLPTRKRIRITSWTLRDSGWT